jgi:hypothetical protein
MFGREDWDVPLTTATFLFLSLSGGTIYCLFQVETLAWDQWLWWIVMGDLVAVAGLWIWLCLRHDKHTFFMVGVTAALVFTAILAGAHALDDNPYHVTHGTVVGHEHSDATVTPLICSNGICNGGTYIPESWKLVVQECRDSGCVTGAVPVDSGAYNRYTDGSHYP